MEIRPRPEPDDRHEQDSRRSEIAAKIEAGYAAAQRGELTDADEVRRRLEDRKRARKAEILRRMEEIDSGKVAAETLDEARRKLASALE